MNLPELPSFDPASFTVDAMGSATVQAAVMIFAFFVLVTLIALSRRYLTHSSMRGVTSGIFIGFMLLVAIEAGLVWLSKEVLNTDNSKLVPESVRAMLGTGQQKATEVLGVKTERAIPTAQTVVTDFEDLGKLDAKLVKDSICKEISSTGEIK